MSTNLVGEYPIEISGATGPRAAIINGIYEPTTETHGNITVYRKRGGEDTWLEYGGGGMSSWAIKDSSQKGSRNCIAFLSTRSCLPDNVQGDRKWRIFNGRKSNTADGCLKSRDSPLPTGSNIRRKVSRLDSKPFADLH